MTRPNLTATPLLVAALAGLTLTACDEAGGGGAAPHPAACTVDMDNEGSDARLVLLQDGSRSKDGASEYSMTLATRILSDASLEGPNLTIGTYGGSDAEITFSTCFNSVHFRANFNQERRRREAAPGLIAAAVQDLENLPSGWTTTDTTSALRAGAEKLRGSDEGERRLVILTDGIPTAGCAQLPESTDPTDHQLIPELVEHCKATNAIPNLRGIDVVLIGVGRTGTGLTSESVAFLTALNEALCEASDANCTVAIDVPSDV